MPLAPEYQAMFGPTAATEPTPSLSEIPGCRCRDAYRAMRPVNPELTISRNRRQVSGPWAIFPSASTAPRAMVLLAPWFISMAVVG